MSLHPWIRDIMGCAFAATLLTAVAVVGMCLLAHPLLLTLLVVTGLWYRSYRRRQDCTSSSNACGHS